MFRKGEKVRVNFNSYNLRELKRRNRLLSSYREIKKYSKNLFIIHSSYSFNGDTLYDIASDTGLIMNFTFHEEDLIEITSDKINNLLGEI